MATNEIQQLANRTDWAIKSRKKRAIKTLNAKLLNKYT